MRYVMRSVFWSEEWEKNVVDFCIIMDMVWRFWPCFIYRKRLKDFVINDIG